MSDIKVGDLVVIELALPCCGRPSKHQGEMFVVASFREILGRCGKCGNERSFHIASNGRLRAEVSRLRKVPPLNEPDHSTTEAMDPADCLAWHREKAHG